jgi:hypothetical protein
MPDIFKNAILITWRRDVAYALRLVGDLSDQQMIAQPVPGRAMNHPAWTLAHLSLYNDVIAKMLGRVPVRRSEGSSVRNEVVAAERSAGLPAARAGDGGIQALARRRRARVGRMRSSVFAEDVPLERWRALHPKIADMTVMLMVKHESMHLGQLSAWRRAMGLGRVEM